jgi:outer membrane protein assembly factor BamB
VNNNLYAFEPADGTFSVGWPFPNGFQIYGPHAIDAEGTVYAGTSDGGFYAVRPDGTLKWVYWTGDVILGGPAIAPDGTVYAGSRTRKLYAFRGTAGLADSPWPKFRQNPRNTGRVENPWAPIQFEGFLPPIGGADATGGTFSEPVRTFKMKTTIPVKFKALQRGSSVLTGVHTLLAVKYSNATTSEAPIDATPQDGATTGNQFRLAEDTWHFNLDTQATGMSTGIWLLTATLSDCSQHSAWIQLK